MKNIQTYFQFAKHVVPSYQMRFGGQRMQGIYMNNGMKEMDQHDTLCPAQYARVEYCYYCSLIRRARKEERLKILHYRD
jgi:hypothetical protein